jgi:hypothetical protein
MELDPRYCDAILYRYQELAEGNENEVELVLHAYDLTKDGE